MNRLFNLIELIHFYHQINVVHRIQPNKTIDRDHHEAVPTARSSSGLLMWWAEQKYFSHFVEKLNSLIRALRCDWVLRHFLDLVDEISLLVEL